jgi:hypothetical protein
MERASKLIRGMQLPGGAISPEELACAAWPEAVGKKVARHTRAVKLVRNCLVVEVEDAVWQKQLFTLSPLILRALGKILGPGLIEETYFKIVPRRREPQRARQSAPGLFNDEAEAIEDPVIRGIYRAARKRETA